MGRFATLISDEDVTLPLTLGVTMNDLIPKVFLRDLVPVGTRLPPANRRDDYSYRLRAAFRFTLPPNQTTAVLEESTLALSVENREYASWVVRREPKPPLPGFAYTVAIPAKPVAKYLEGLQRTLPHMAGDKPILWARLMVYYQNGSFSIRRAHRAARSQLPGALVCQFQKEFKAPTQTWNKRCQRLFI